MMKISKLLSAPMFYHSVWSVITANRGLIYVKFAGLVPKECVKEKPPPVVKSENVTYSAPYLRNELCNVRRSTSLTALY